jgi:thymidine kinase
MFDSDLTSGVVEVICGPMFSGKTEELLRRIRRAEIAQQKVTVFKPAIDNRYAHEQVCSHIGHSFSAIVINGSSQILDKVSADTKVVAIDEVQFFDNDIVEIVSILADRGLRVICAGLDQDHLGEPFGPMPSLLSIADKVDKLYAVCKICGGPATKSLRVNTDNQKRVLVGEFDYYEARCRKHYNGKRPSPELQESLSLFGEK